MQANLRTWKFAKPLKMVASTSLLRLNRFQTKLVAGFISLALVGIIFAFYCVGSLRAANDLVNRTYDQALMTSTFARTAQHNYSRFNSGIKAAFISRNRKESDERKLAAEAFAEDANNDLDVVAERTLKPGNRDLVRASQAQIIAGVENARKMLDRPRNFSDQEDVALFREWQEKHSRGPVFETLSMISDSAMEEGYLFRLEANLKSAKMIRFTVVILSLMGAMGFATGWMLLYSALPPLIRLNEACAAIVSGEVDKRVDLKSKDEFGELADSFNEMLDRLQARGRNIRSLLRSVPAAIFFFDQAGAISKEQSPKTQQWFGKMNSIDSIIEFFDAYVPEHKKDLKRMLTMLWDPAMNNRVDVLLELFPREIILNYAGYKKYLAVSYFAQRGRDERIERVIVIIHDRSREVRAETRRIEKDYEIARVLNALSLGFNSSRRFFAAQNSRFQALLEGPKTALTLRETKRVIHTLKGSLSVFGFHECSTIIHSLETEIWNASIENHVAQQIIWDRYLWNFDQQFADLARLIKADDGADDQIRISAHKLQALHQLLGEIDSPALHNWVATLDFVDIKDVFARYSAYIVALQNEFKSKQFILKTSTRNVEIPRPQMFQLETMLTHLVRNAVVHGIEPADERRALGKSPVGTITILVNQVGPGQVEVEVSDDGRGLPMSRFRKYAATRGIWTESQAAVATDAEVIDLLFLQDVSLAPEVSQTAGRGVGLDAVREALAALDAQLKITSVTGAHFKLTFQLSV